MRISDWSSDVCSSDLDADGEFCGVSDMIDAYRDLKAYQRAKRLIWGVPCPVCREKLPRANAKILEPGRICRAHKTSYRDPRPEPTEEAFAARMAAHGRGAQRSEQHTCELPSRMRSS